MSIAPRADRPAAQNAPLTPIAPKGKLSFKDKHALETLPNAIKALENEIATLQATLADPALYARDAKGFDAKSKLLDAKEAERARAEEQWLELEIKRESVEG